MGTDSEQSTDALIPVEQISVPFYGHELVAIRLEDGRICAALRWLCEGMGLDPQGQLQRIQRKTALREHVALARIQTPGGPQTMPVLDIDGITGWLYCIDETRVKAETREAVVLFQREATKVLGHHFSQRPAELAAPPDLVPAEPITRPEKPERDAPPLVWAEYYEGMAAWLRWQDDIEQWRGSVESRLESVEEITRLVPEILDRLGPQTLSPEHQATVKAWAKRLNELTGSAYATIYAELNEAFHVGKYSDIPENAWLRVAEWFRARITAAEKWHPH